MVRVLPERAAVKTSALVVTSAVTSVRRFSVAIVSCFVSLTVPPSATVFVSNSTLAGVAVIEPSQEPGTAANTTFLYRAIAC